MKNNFVAKFMNRFNRASVEQDSRQELLDKIELLEAEIEVYKLKDNEKEKGNTYVFKRGDRVQANQTAGFNKGAKGVVQYVEPCGKIWVLRDGASGDIFYHAEELELI